MSDFWARKLGQQTPRQQVPVRPVPPVQSAHRPWWDTTPQEQAVQQVMTETVQEYRPHQAKSLALTDICPDCSSTNYMSPPGTSARKRCFDCGHPFAQTGSQGIQTQGGTPATPARQIHDGSSNYNPQNIIGRIS